jgi:hypothetical protein
MLKRLDGSSTQIQDSEFTIQSSSILLIISAHVDPDIFLLAGAYPDGQGAIARPPLPLSMSVPTMIPDKRRSVLWNQSAID